MAEFIVDNVKIAGICAAVPSRVEKTIHMKRLSGEYDNEEYSRSTGVYERRKSDTLTTVDLAVEAVKKMLQELGWQSSEIEAIVLVTQTPDYIEPASSCILQDKLMLPKSCFAIDISLGCSGWVYGLGTLSALVSSAKMRKCLLVAGDAKHNHNFPLDPLSGFAVTVTALEYCEGESFKFNFGTDGSGWNALYIPDGGARNPFTESSLVPRDYNGKMLAPVQSHMDGMDVFSFGISVPVKTIRELESHFSISDGDVDYYVFHQANKLMVDTIAKRLKIDTAKVPMSLELYGNTSSASIPLTIASRLRDKVGDGMKLICCGFGIGLSWGAVYLALGKDTVIPEIVEVEDTASL